MTDRQADSIKPLTDAAKAQRMFPAPESLPKVDVPENIAALRDADMERKMYSAQSTLRRELPDNLLDAVDMPAPRRAAAVAEMREIARDIGLQGDALRSAVTAAQTLTKAPLTDDQVGVARTTIATDLRTQYGKDAEQCWNDAQTLINRDHRLARFLESSGLGDHPATMMHIVELAKQARYAGKIS